VKISSVNFDRALNLATVCLLVAVVVGLVRQQSDAAPSRSKNVPKAGTEIAFSGVDWAKNHETVLLVLASDCSFCQNSAEFHRVVAGHERPGLHVIALFKRTDTVETAKAYLGEHRITVQDVRTASLSSVSATGTPTIEVIDGAGHVVRSWVGELDHAGEQEVLAALERDDSWARRHARAAKGFFGIN
jgi:hypothetical protein